MCRRVDYSAPRERRRTLRPSLGVREEALPSLEWLEEGAAPRGPAGDSEFRELLPPACGGASSSGRSLTFRTEAVSITVVAFHSVSALSSFSNPPTPGPRERKANRESQKSWQEKRYEGY